jgi:hypothetical protein
MPPARPKMCLQIPPRLGKIQRRGHRAAARAFAALMTTRQVEDYLDRFGTGPGDCGAVTGLPALTRSITN